MESVKFYYNHERIGDCEINNITDFTPLYLLAEGNKNIIEEIKDYLFSMGCSEWVDEVDVSELVYWFLYDLELRFDEESKVNYSSLSLEIFTGDEV